MLVTLSACRDQSRFVDPSTQVTFPGKEVRNHAQNGGKK